MAKAGGVAYCGIGGNDEGMPRSFFFSHGGSTSAVWPGGIPQVDGQLSMVGFGSAAGRRQRVCRGTRPDRAAGSLSAAGCAEAEGDHTAQSAAYRRSTSDNRRPNEAATAESSSRRKAQRPTAPATRPSRSARMARSTSARPATAATAGCSASTPPPTRSSWTRSSACAADRRAPQASTRKGRSTPRSSSAPTAGSGSPASKLTRSSTPGPNMAKTPKAIPAATSAISTRRPASAAAWAS